MLAGCWQVSREMRMGSIEWSKRHIWELWSLRGLKPVEAWPGLLWYDCLVAEWTGIEPYSFLASDCWLQPTWIITEQKLL